MTHHRCGTSTSPPRLVSTSRASPEYSKPEPDEALELARRILRLRRMRNMRWESIRFSDPAWDILLGLFVAHYEAKSVARSDAVSMAAVPPTTARRAIGSLLAAKLLNVCPDPGDRRRQFLKLDPALVGDLTSMLAKMAGHA